MPSPHAPLLHAVARLDRRDRVALITADDTSVTYGALADAAGGVARFLVQRGVRRGERVVLLLDDTVAFYTAFLGAMAIGAVPVPINFLLRPEDIAYILDDSYAVAVVVDAPLREKLDPTFAERTHVQVFVANGDAGPHASFDAVPPADLEPVAIDPDDDGLWLYSSGSTGRPKGIVHRLASLTATVRSFAEGVLNLGPADTVYSTTPLFHAYGLGNSLTFPLSVGAKVVLGTGRREPGRILGRIATHRPTVLFSVPALYAAMLTDPRLDETDWSGVRQGVSAAEALPAEVGRQFQARTKVEVLDGIGSTEVLHIYCSNRPGEVRFGTSGTAVPGYELEIRDESGAAVGPDESGELWVRGDSVLMRYWHLVERTQAKLRGDWFASGDRYHRDAKGCFVYEGRVDDMIKIGGLWVSPIEIEGRLMEHPAVHEAAVVGTLIEERSRIVAYVILAEGHTGDDGLVEALQQWCKEALQRYQFPHVVRFVDDVPRTATGKIQRFKLRALD